MPLKNVADHEMPEFMRNFEEVFKMAMVVDKALSVFHAIFNNEEYTKKLISIVSGSRWSTFCRS